MFLRYKAASKSLGSIKRFNSTLRIAEEIQHALNTHQPVVALESTIITHGLPFPQNIQMAKQVESVIRENGAVPATIAFVEGKPCIGLNSSEIEMLAAAKNVNKVSRRDIAYSMARKLNGGTTISGTMILAEKAGIKVFSTGGLGGVHKKAETTFDISADLTELGRTKVAVVCAGPKSILDVAKTTEYLETQGCFVATMGPYGTNIPGFFAVDSGVKSPYNFETFGQAAEIVNSGINDMNLDSGYLLCIPPPMDVALDSDYINNIIAEAEKEAEQLGIFGKNLTPFLLSKVAKLTKGTSVDTNLQVVFNNARAGANIAVELAKIEKGDKLPVKPVAFTPLTKLNKLNLKAQQSQMQASSKVNIAVIGSVAVDLICRLKPEKYHIGDSNPGTSSSSIGGVAFNVSMASKFSATRGSHTTTRLIGQIGDDDFGKLITRELTDNGIDTSGLIMNSQYATAKYVSIHDKQGGLVVACADMDIAENFQDQELLEKLEAAEPEIVLVDGNVGVSSFHKVIKKSLNLGSKVVFEPTSSIKASKISKVIKEDPSSFIFSSMHVPSILEAGIGEMNGLILATPTAAELRSIHDQMDEDMLFDVTNWFPVLDAMGINSEFRNRLDSIKSDFLKDVLKQGVLQQSFKILPYIPALAIKFGKKGIIVVNLTLDANKVSNDLARLETHPKSEDILKKPKFTIASKGKTIDGSRQLGVMIQYYEVPTEITNVVNVTGAGDCFAGCLIQQMADKGILWLFEQGELRDKLFNRAQIAAGLSLQCETAVSDEISKL